ncbi:VIT family protein [Nocardioides sp. dk4132]|uniref:VIT1/CCC1 transporter family protein n=1 Tax=unclassified Nocardioides TaxID=2615069 RepID=UPI0012948D75|nr:MULTISPECIES: VIT family protein [unclassified Nocardioides]MQW77639.1 VIT family protein [Nocardioides sp. dk4132]QGA06164.1 VIT family protein [Nocardioides sp. dk884]
MSPKARHPASTTHPGEPGGPGEPGSGGVRGRLNWLRAGVMGANDGVVSTAGLVVGVAGATTDQGAIAVAGVSGLVSGAISMAAGEYLSTSTQRDSELAMLDTERRELAEQPEAEREELAGLLVERGLSEDVAREAAEQMMARDPLAAHARVELGIDPDDITNPWAAAFASAVSFVAGALLPLLVILLAPDDIRVVVTVLSVLVALAITGVTSATLGYAPRTRAVVRNVAGGALAMGVTYAIGSLLGTQV